jgi:hypothetical protein
LTYLNTQREGNGRSNSSRRELIDSSRKILFTNINILEKKREAEAIHGDLLAEVERVREAKHLFEIDTDRYIMYKLREAVK